MTNIAIRATDLSKCYYIYNNPHDRLKQFVIPRLRQIVRLTPKQYFHEFWALNNISFEIEKGETVGVLGRNGSGKSTLLQLLCGTLTPTTGSVEINGRVAALLELGSGFNPEFTGRENVYMNASILGLTQQEITERFDDIAAFADIGEFIEQPVKTYSSGMFVRLAFAVNIISSPDIMIVDEALAVGDMNFQAKCMTALKRIQDGGATVLFVSHDIGSIKSLCSRGIYLDRGQMKKIGKASDVAEHYVRVMREEMSAQTTNTPMPVSLDKFEANTPQTDTKLDFKTSAEFEKKVANFRYGEGSAKITFVELLDEDNQPITHAEFNQTVTIRIHFESYIDTTSLACNYYIADDKKNLILGADPVLVTEKLISVVAGGKYIVTYKTYLPLQEGNYSIQIQLTKDFIPNVSSVTFIDVIDNAIVFNMARRNHTRVWAKVFIDNQLDVVSCQ